MLLGQRQKSAVQTRSVLQAEKEEITQNIYLNCDTIIKIDFKETMW